MGEIVVPSRRGQPQAPPEPSPPHVPVTGARQWRLVHPAGAVTTEVRARDHRWKLVNGAGSVPLYLLLFEEGSLQLRLIPDPPLPGGGVFWQTELRPKDPTYTGPLRYGESLCLWVSRSRRGASDSGYVTIQSVGGPMVGSVRDIGRSHSMELSARGQPEWKVEGGGEGQPLRVGDWFALRNTRIGDRVVFSPTGGGPDLSAPGFQTDRLVNNPLRQYTYTLRLEANVPYEGVICWHGRFPLMGGARPDAYLTKVGVPRSHSFPVTLVFWSPARRRFDVRVAEGASMTTDQMRDVFGYLKPPLPVDMWALVEAQYNVNVGSVVVNLEYMG